MFLPQLCIQVKALEGPQPCQPIEVHHYLPKLSNAFVVMHGSGPTSPVVHRSLPAVPCMRRGQTVVEVAGQPPPAPAALQSRGQPAGAGPAGAQAPPCQVDRPIPVLALERLAMPDPS